jgi:hypothetical protein
MNGIGLIAARCLQSELQGLGHVAGFHSRTQLPRNHIAAEVIQNRGQIHPTPTDDFQVREVPEMQKRWIAVGRPDPADQLP